MIIFLRTIFQFVFVLNNFSRKLSCFSNKDQKNLCVLSNLIGTNGSLRAQARGIPVIIYKDAKIPEEVKKFCIPARDEFEMLELAKKIKESGYNEKLRIKMKTYARSFTWEKCAKDTLKVYQRVLK